LETFMRRGRHPITTGLIALAVFACASGAALAADPPPPTKSLQGAGEEQRAFIDNPNMHAFYDLSVATLRANPAKVDVEAYEAKSYVFFRALGVDMGVGPDAMQDHLKAIPRQVVQIVKDDPKVLDSYGAFVIALVGPP
jgi:hypothetical protein